LIPSCKPSAVAKANHISGLASQPNAMRPVQRYLKCYTFASPFETFHKYHDPSKTSGKIFHISFTY
jgi:hypothetical protein